MSSYTLLLAEACLLTPMNTYSVCFCCCRLSGPQGSVRPFTIVKDPSAWKPADWKKNQDWVYRLSSGDIAELDAAVAAAVIQGIRREVCTLTWGPACRCCPAPSLSRRAWLGGASWTLDAAGAALTMHVRLAVHTTRRLLVQSVYCCRATTCSSGRCCPPRLPSHFRRWAHAWRLSVKTSASAGASS